VPGQKRGPPNEIGHSRGGTSTKIHAAVDAYGYPVYIMLSEGQRNDINYAIPILEHINIEGSQVLADRVSMQISIHTPARGVTKISKKDITMKEISIHTPARGVTG